MAAIVVDIRKRKYVCGLFWQSLSRPRELRAEAVELARKLNFDLLVLRKDLGVAQAGFASSREGAHKGMLSLGALVAATVAARGVQGNPQGGTQSMQPGMAAPVQDGRRLSASSWLAALRLDDERWAYFAVRDDSFLPAGDFAGSRAEVLERLYADYGLGGWNAVIGDPELADQGFHDFHAVTIDEFVPRTSARRPWLASAWELKPVQRSPQVAWAVGGVGALAVLVGGGVWLQRQHAAKQELERQQAMLTAQQRMAAQLAQQVPAPPWPVQPTPDAFARACSAQLQLLAPGGWTLDEYACSPTSARYTWSRGDSNVGYLLQQLPQANVDLSGEKARYEQPLTVPHGSADALLPAQTLLQPLQARLQQLGLRMTLKGPPAAPPRPTLPGVRQLAPPPPQWTTYTFSLGLNGLPLSEVAAALSQPGVRVNTMTYRQGDWWLEGVAYAK
jgi:hypothetical protein